MSKEYEGPSSRYQLGFVRGSAKTRNELSAEIERLHELKTPATRELLNITKGLLDAAEAENANLRVLFTELRNLVGYIESVNDERDSVSLLIEVRRIVNKASIHE